MKSLTESMHDGAKFHAAITARLEKLPEDKEWPHLIKVAGLDPSTAWRWSQGSKPEIESVLRIEKVLKRWEVHHQSNSSMPSARR